jgi:hypothetical protein
MVGLGWWACVGFWWGRVELDLCNARGGRAVRGGSGVGRSILKE